MNKTPINPPHYIVGHLNPDTDSVVSAYVLAWLNKQLDPEVNAIPIRLGEINRQTAWLFKQAKAVVPKLRTSCLYQASEICREVPLILANEPLRKALESIQKADTGFAAIIDEQCQPIGIVSDRTRRTNYLLQCNVEDFFGTLLDFDHIIRGLPLEPLNDCGDVEIEHLKLPVHQREKEDEWAEGTALIVGNNTTLIQELQENPPSAIILAEVESETAKALAEGISCPVFHYAGSIISMLMRLPGCFPASAALQEHYISVDEQTNEEELNRQVKDSAWGVMVIDIEGQVSGSINALDMLNLKRPRVSLVDHSERSQSIEGLHDAEVVEILDHHRLGDVETIEPLIMDVRPWGSTATILYERIVDKNIEIPANIATLLFGAIVSDTLLLTSPTCTKIDINAAQNLAQIADLNLHLFGKEVLKQNDELLTANVGYLVNKDCKQFAYNEIEFVASQIETIDLSTLTQERLVALMDALGAVIEIKSVAFGVLMITDVVQGKSRLEVISPDEKWKQTLIPIEFHDQPLILENFVSRKKQLIPLLLKTIRKAKS